ncbi:BTB/POZ protein, partial [Massariosphaeria phaeospora]
MRLSTRHSADNRSLFNDPWLSDITIRQIHNGVTKEYHGHKAVLCNHSTFFRKAFNGNFKESTDHVIELHDDDPYCFETMMRYLYTFNWEEPKTEAWKPRSNLGRGALTAIGVYSLADKYDIEALRKSALRQLSVAARNVAREPLSWMDFDMIIKTYYPSCDQVGSDIGLEIAAAVLQLPKEEFYDGWFHFTVEDYPIFGADVLLTLYNNPTLSDVKIKQISKGKTCEYYAHKAILCRESGFFMRAFTGSFKEASDAETELHDDEADYFEFLLKFIYTEKYDKDALAKMADRFKIEKVLVAIDINTIASKYDVRRLYEPAAEDVSAMLISNNYGRIDDTAAGDVSATLSSSPHDRVDDAVENPASWGFSFGCGF